jgi:hypothetical protein
MVLTELVHIIRQEAGMGKRKLQEALTLGSSVKRLEDGEDLWEEDDEVGEGGLEDSEGGDGAAGVFSSARSSSARRPMNGSSAGMAGAAPLRRQRGSSSGLLKWQRAARWFWGGDERQRRGRPRSRRFGEEEEGRAVYKGLYP